MVQLTSPGPAASLALVTANLTRPRALAFDPHTRQLFWADSRRGHFWISRVRADGGGRAVVCSYEGSSQDAFSVAVDRDWVYWSDWASHAVWRVDKRGADCTPRIVTSFPTARPHGILAWPATEPSCDGVSAEDIAAAVTERDTAGRGDTTESSAAAAHAVSAEEGACTNYCVHGSCALAPDQVPECSCAAGWAGPRCAEAACHNWCLQGTCVLLGEEPECLCGPGWAGDRCQERSSSAAAASSDPQPGAEGRDQVLVWSLASATGLLALATLVLSVAVHRLRLRPRVVRKRFISVSRPEAAKDKARDSVTGCGLPVEAGVALDIENCCNMTLCETVRCHIFLLRTMLNDVHFPALF